MTYSIIGIITTVVLIINNRDVLWVRGEYSKASTYKAYRNLLLGILAYLITDILWGILESHHLITAVYIDTIIHFIAMAAAVILWTKYVKVYLGDKQGFSKFLYYAGCLFLCFEAVIVVINLFTPILFSFDSAGEYHAGIADFNKRIGYDFGKMIIIAIDLVGGLFALNIGGFEDDIGMVWYFAPDTLSWESLGFNYSEFIAWLSLITLLNKKM